MAGRLADSQAGNLCATLPVPKTHFCVICCERDSITSSSSWSACERDKAKNCWRCERCSVRWQADNAAVLHALEQVRGRQQINLAKTQTEAATMLMLRLAQRLRQRLGFSLWQQPTHLACRKSRAMSRELRILLRKKVLSVRQLLVLLLSLHFFSYFPPIQYMLFISIFSAAFYFSLPFASAVRTSTWVVVAKPHKMTPLQLHRRSLSLSSVHKNANCNWFH